MSVSIRIAIKNESIQCKSYNDVTIVIVPYITSFFLCEINAHSRTYYTNPTILHLLANMYVPHIKFLDFIGPLELILVSQKKSTLIYI